MPHFPYFILSAKSRNNSIWEVGICTAAPGPFIGYLTPLSLVTPLRCGSLHSVTKQGCQGSSGEVCAEDSLSHQKGGGPDRKRRIWGDPLTSLTGLP